MDRGKLDEEFSTVQIRHFLGTRMIPLKYNNRLDLIRSVAGAPSLTEIRIAKAQHVIVTEGSLTVDLSDGRTISVPIGWYPRLLYGTPEGRNNWCLIGGGEGIHWTDLDEDISVENLLAGKPSGERQRSFKSWLEMRAAEGRTQGNG